MPTFQEDLAGFESQLLNLRARFEKLKPFRDNNHRVQEELTSLTRQAGSELIRLKLLYPAEASQLDLVEADHDRLGGPHIRITDAG